ncbi:MAG: AAA family ATPase [Lachnospiraceae bacterium]|nr:AAA family ATPase [Lachnospiraceae bacterium]
MYRNIIEDMIEWQEERNRQMLYIKGAVGVGKTWIVKDFATAFYPACCYVDCTEGVSANTDELDSLLASRFSEEELTKGLIVFDEVQHIPDAAEFFYDYKKLHKDFHICLIASNMQITEFEYTHGDCYKLLRLRPMTFEEYLIANRAGAFIEAIKSGRYTFSQLETDALERLLADYLMIGGMPGVVSAFIRSKNYEKVRLLQDEINDANLKLLKSELPDAMYQRTKRVFKSIPKQLSKDNKKFMYKSAEANARSREYAEATQLLCDYGLARKLPRLTDGKLPLEDYVDYKSFELFFLDHGLLRASLKLPISDKLTLNELMNESGGAVAEQYLFTELSSAIGILYYWVSGATARVPFVYEGSESPIPIDIRYNRSKHPQNIKVFKEKNPDTTSFIRVTADEYAENSYEKDIPLYALWSLT